LFNLDKFGICNSRGRKLSLPETQALNTEIQIETFELVPTKILADKPSMIVSMGVFESMFKLYLLANESKYLRPISRLLSERMLILDPPKRVFSINL
jgi:hypothetical protein